MISVVDVRNSILSSFANSAKHDTPYPYFLLKNILPDQMLSSLQDLPFRAPDLAGVSGTREVHNKSRNYFDQKNCEKYEVCRLLAEALQSSEIVSEIEKLFNTNLKSTLLRIEYGQDTDGFWLEPHTDIGVKNFTMLLYLSDEDGHEKLGTSIYSDKYSHLGETPFAPNVAMVFIPSDHSWHGFEPRPIHGVRKSIIINYVTQDWRAREQLPYPDQPVA